MADPTQVATENPFGIQQMLAQGGVVAKSTFAVLVIMSFASWYSCAFVRPPGPRCDRRPPRRPDEMSRVDVGLDVLASPERARSLFTVRAAIASVCSCASRRPASPPSSCTS